MSQERMSIFELFEMFPNDQVAEQWFIQQRWPDGVCCAFCESGNILDSKAHKEMKFRCNDCKKWFSAKSNSLMHSSKLGYQKWAIAFYIVASHPKGLSSIQLSKMLGVTQKTAWHLLHRIRKAYDTIEEPFEDEVEIDEAFVGGLEKNKHADKKLRAGSGTVGKTIVIGMKERATNRIKAEVVPDRKHRTVSNFIEKNTTRDTMVYTDEFRAYNHIPRKRQFVQHKAKQYVIQDAPEVHTQGIESFWAIIKRGHKGVHHMMSPKHLHRYVAGYVGRFNHKEETPAEHMATLVRGADKKRLRYADLVAGPRWELQGEGN